MNIELPHLPETLIQLIDACNDPERDIASVGLIVSRDVSLAGRVLQLANSAFLGARSSFSDIGQAVIYLGMDTLRNLAISISVHDAFSDTTAKIPFDTREFWYHSLLCGMISKELAEICGYEEPSEAYLAGLLHDMGKWILSTSAPEKAKRYAVPEPVSPGEETQLFGISHAEAGAQLVDHWKLEQRIADAIREHHCSPTGEAMLALLLQLANELTSTPGPRSLELARHVTEQCGAEFDDARLQTIHVEMQEMVDQVAASLGIAVRKPDSKEKKDVTHNSKQKLRHKVRTGATFSGFIDNLLRAEDTERGYQVIEETIVIVFGIERSLLLLSDSGIGTYQAVGSSRNSAIRELGSKPVRLNAPLSAGSHSHPSFQPFSLSRNSLPDETPLFTALASNSLLFSPLYLGEDAHGYLVLPNKPPQEKGQDDGQALLASNEFKEDLRVLTAHTGSWLQIQKERKRRQEARLQSRIDTLKGVARGLGHEITTPLATIRNYLYLLKNRLAHQPEVQEELSRIDQEIARIGKICGQLKDLAPTSTDDFLPIDLNDIVTDTVKLFEQANGKGQDIRIHFFPCSRLRRFISQPDHIRQILTNLISNSLDAIGERGIIRITIRLNTTSQPPMVHITVSDNGSGIPPHLRDRLFTPGYTTKGGGHSGFGLSIVQKLVVDLGGEVILLSERDKGCSFQVSLPYQLP